MATMGLSAKWIKFITNTNNTHPGINYPLIKTHKADNPARVITSGCSTPTENLSLFVEKYCKIALDSISCRVRDTTHMPTSYPGYLLLGSEIPWYGLVT